MRDILIDGISLHQRKTGYWLTKATTIPASANQKVTTVEVPFVDGALVIPGGYGLGQVMVEIVVRGSFGDLNKRVSHVQALLSSARELTLVEDGNLSVEVVRATVAEPAWSTEHSVKIRCVFDVQPFWHTADLVTENIETSGGVTTLRAWNGATAPPADLQIRLSGNFDAVKIIAPNSGEWFSINYELRAGKWLYVDTANREYWVGETDDSWLAPTTVFPLDYSPSGAPVFLPEFKESSTTVKINFAFTRLQGTASIQVRGRKWYL